MTEQRLLLDGKVDLRIGDCRAVMREIPDNHVDCVITSVPYYGLRDYGIEPSIFGGNPRCAHDWGEETSIVRGGPHGDGVMLRGGRSVVAAQAETKIMRQGCFCLYCGAWKGQLGLEPSLALYIDHIVEVFEEVRRILKKTGVLWFNIGDTYAGDVNGRSAADGKKLGTDDRTFRDKPFSTVGPVNDRVVGGGLLKPKDRMMIPARLAIALNDAGWHLRDEIVWAKNNPMPSSIKDRTTPAHEMVYLLTKKGSYFFDNDAIREPFADGRMGADYPRPNAPDKIKSPHGQGFTRDAKKPAGWDQGDGHHERSHRQGREAPESQRNVGGRTDGFTKPNAIDPSENGGRNKRSVWTLSTEPMSDAHFATFPTKLITPMVLAGTSARGNCQKCGKPWKRVVYKMLHNPGNRTTNGPRSIAHKQIEGGSAGFEQRLETSVRTVGWWPTCECDGLGQLPKFPKEPKAPKSDSKRAIKKHERAVEKWQTECDRVAAERALQIPKGELILTDRAVLLDPFGGSGTVGIVGARLGRQSILIEIKPEYADIAERRIRMEWSGPDERQRIANEDKQLPPETTPLFAALAAPPEEATDEKTEEESQGTSEG